VRGTRDFLFNFISAYIKASSVSIALMGVRDPARSWTAFCRSLEGGLIEAYKLQPSWSLSPLGYIGEGALQKAVNVLIAPVTCPTSSHVSSRAPTRCRTRLS